MSEFETESVFRCADCGARAPSRSVSYGPLGYAICPACGTSTRPSVPLERDAWVWSSDALERPSD
jgi:hypothetical protein